MSNKDQFDLDIQVKQVSSNEVESYTTGGGCVTIQGICYSFPRGC